MKHLALVIILALFSPITIANKFVGSWEVTKVDYPETISVKLSTLNISS